MPSSACKKIRISDGEAALNCLSIACVLIMMALVLCLRFTQPAVAKTVSFKLSFWIGLVDALFRASYLLNEAIDFLDAYLFPNGVASNYWLSKILLWTIFFFPLW